MYIPMQGKIYVKLVLPGLDFNAESFSRVSITRIILYILNTWNVNRDYRVAVSVKGVPEGRVDYAISAFCG